VKDSVSDGITETLLWQFTKLKRTFHSTEFEALGFNSTYLPIYTKFISYFGRRWKGGKSGISSCTAAIANYAP